METEQSAVARGSVAPDPLVRQGARVPPRQYAVGELGPRPLSSQPRTVARVDPAPQGRAGRWRKPNPPPPSIPPNNPSTSPPIPPTNTSAKPTTPKPGLSW